MTAYIFEGIWNMKVGLDGKIALRVIDTSVSTDIYEYPVVYTFIHVINKHLLSIY